MAGPTARKSCKSLHYRRCGRCGRYFAVFTWDVVLPCRDHPIDQGPLEDAAPELEVSATLVPDRDKTRLLGTQPREQGPLVRHSVEGAPRAGTSRGSRTRTYRKRAGPSGVPPPYGFSIPTDPRLTVGVPVGSGRTKTRVPASTGTNSEVAEMIGSIFTELSVRCIGGHDLPGLSFLPVHHTPRHRIVLNEHHDGFGDLFGPKQN
jgi:hypothetical protein